MTHFRNLIAGDVIRMRHGRGTILATVRSRTTHGLKVVYTSRRTGRQIDRPVEIHRSAYVSAFRHAPR